MADLVFTASMDAAQVSQGAKRAESSIMQIGREMSRTRELAAKLIIPAAVFASVQRLSQSFAQMYQEVAQARTAVADMFVERDRRYVEMFGPKLDPREALRKKMVDDHRRELEDLQKQREERLSRDRFRVMTLDPEGNWIPGGLDPRPNNEAERVWNEYYDNETSRLQADQDRKMREQGFINDLPAENEKISPARRRRLADEERRRAAREARQKKDKSPDGKLAELDAKIAAAKERAVEDDKEWVRRAEEYGSDQDPRLNALDARRAKSRQQYRNLMEQRDALSQAGGPQAAATEKSNDLLASVVGELKTLNKNIRRERGATYGA